MDGHLVPASSNSKIRCSLENFTLDVERWFAALYWRMRGCVRLCQTATIRSLLCLAKFAHLHFYTLVRSLGLISDWFAA